MMDDGRWMMMTMMGGGFRGSKPSVGSDVGEAVEMARVLICVSFWVRRHSYSSSGYSSSECLVSDSAWQAQPALARTS